MAALKHSQLITYLETHFKEFNSNPPSDRIKALYSDFSKSWILNKYAFDTNLNFWRRVILDSNQQGHLHASDYLLVIDKRTLSEQFLRPIVGKPLSLPIVIEHMEKENELISLKSFYKKYTIAQSSNWYHWIANSMYRYWWKRAEEADEDVEEDVVLPTLQSIVKAILVDHYTKKEGRGDIMTLSQFKAQYAHGFYNNMELTDGDIHLILKYLHSQHNVAIADHMQGYSGSYYMIIKFPQTENAIQVDTTITEHDKAIISIRTTCHALSLQVSELQKKAEKLSKEAIIEKNNGHIPKALYCLKRKKSLQDILEKRLKSMETMDTILLKIESSKDDIQIIRAFNMGADTLKNFIHYEGLDIQSIDDVMQNVQMALEDQKEIDDAFKMDTSSDFVDEEQLEHELSELIKEKAAPLPNKEQRPTSELARLNEILSTSTQNKKKESPVLLAS